MSSSVIPSEDILRNEYIKVLEEDTTATRTDKLRKLILYYGIPEENGDDKAAINNGECTLRGLIWKVLLDIDHIDANGYISLVERGPSSFHMKICDDTFRTFMSNEEYTKRCPEDMLIRLLNAFIHKYGIDNGSLNGEKKHVYVQGMNVLAAPFLFNLPELDAFECFSEFITHLCPRYVTKNLDGVKSGCKLLDEVLSTVDPELATFLRNISDIYYNLYAFPRTLSLCACHPPLTELLRLWDLMIAFGVHINIIFSTAVLVLMRKQLLESRNPITLLDSKVGTLDSKKIIPMAIDIIHKLPNELYERLSRHPYIRLKSRSVKSGFSRTPDTNTVKKTPSTGHKLSDAIASTLLSPKEMSTGLSRTIRKRPTGDGPIKATRTIDELNFSRAGDAPLTNEISDPTNLSSTAPSVFDRLAGNTYSFTEPNDLASTAPGSGRRTLNRPRSSSPSNTRKKSTLKRPTSAEPKGKKKLTHKSKHDTADFSRSMKNLVPSNDEDNDGKKFSTLKSVSSKDGGDKPRWK